MLSLGTSQAVFAITNAGIFGQNMILFSDPYHSVFVP